MPLKCNFIQFHASNRCLENPARINSTYSSSYAAARRHEWSGNDGGREADDDDDGGREADDDGDKTWQGETIKAEQWRRRTCVYIDRSGEMGGGVGVVG